jgi:hypothetical protein
MIENELTFKLLYRAMLHYTTELAPEVIEICWNYSQSNTK